MRLTNIVWKIAESGLAFLIFFHRSIFKSQNIILFILLFWYFFHISHSHFLHNGHFYLGPFPPYFEAILLAKCDKSISLYLYCDMIYVCVVFISRSVLSCLTTPSPMIKSEWTELSDVTWEWGLGISLGTTNIFYSEQCIL